MVKFIKNNVFFTVLVVSVVLFNVVLFVGLAEVSSNQPTTTPPITSNPNPDPVDPIVPSKESASIENFFGQFNEEENVRLTWRIQENGYEISKVEVYQNDVLLANVTNTTSYELPIYAYGFATGLNEFELRVTQSNGQQISKKASVMIDYVFDVQSNYEIVEEGVLVYVDYRYWEKTPVQLPDIYFSDSRGEILGVTYEKTEVLEQGAYPLARTTYRLQLKDLPDGIYNYDVRWEFTSVNMQVKYPMRLVLGDLDGLR